MPNPAHEVRLQVLHDHPALLAALLEKLGDRTPERALEPVDANLRFADPADAQPDLVFRPKGPCWLLLGLQNRIDPDKARRWIVAAAIQLDATGAMSEIVTLTSSRRVAARAQEVAHMRGDFGSRFELTPVVLPIGAGDEGVAWWRARPALRQCVAPVGGDSGAVVCGDAFSVREGSACGLVLACPTLACLRDGSERKYGRATRRPRARRPVARALR